MSNENRPRQQPTPEDMDRAARQSIMDRGIREYAHGLYEATGKPPMAVIVIVHWPNDIMFASSMSDAPPQAQINAVDLMMRHVSRVGQKMKDAIEKMRHGNPPGTPQH